ncbi:hypothetical protein Alches_05450 [Alicyclobacillus hesperidum subsp. aegles]|nr:hypothetical protein Alches_05450 [Alicyclobacillus hesperidum subsp. aegles]
MIPKLLITHFHPHDLIVYLFLCLQVGLFDVQLSANMLLPNPYLKISQMTYEK